MKKINKQLINQLRLNSRTHLTELSKSLKIPVTTLYDHLRSYEKSNLLKHITLINFERIGYPVTAFIAIKVDYAQKRNLMDELSKNMHINSLHEVTENFDFLAEAVFRDLNEMNALVDDLREHFSVTNIRIMPQISTIKKETFVLN